MRLVISVVALLLSVNVAADLDTGAAAYDAGDYEKAFNEFKPLAEKGDEFAQLMMGDMYTFGRGVLQDDKEAARWYTEVAEYGYDRAQYSLGVMYDQGRGVPKNEKKAVEWYTKAAEQGYLLAQFNLAAMLSQD